jgi:long-chain acyl-CoA synthetase
MIADPSFSASSTGRPIPELLFETAQRHGERVAIDFMGRKWRYREVDRLADRVACGLQALGVRQGTRVGLCLPNSPYSVIFFFGALRAGAIVVHYNPLYVERELAHAVRDSGTEIMVTMDLAAIYPKVAAVASQTGLRHVIVCPMAKALPPITGSLFRTLRRKALARWLPDSRTLGYDALIRTGTGPAPVRIDPDDIAVLQYTGGTTGVPKAAALSHANITCNAAQVIAGMGLTDEPPERVLGVLPLFHIFALTSVMMLSVQTGALMILVPRFDLQDLLKTIARTKPTMFPAVPTIYSAIVEEASKRKLNLASIRLCISGGAPLPIETRDAFMTLTGCELMEGYGLSETSPVVAFTPPDKPYKPGSVGIPVSGTIVEIRSQEDIQLILPQGERGEICVRGPQVMRGYWGKADESDQTFADGALRTGDSGYLDSDGYLFLVDRIKDIIIAGGYNVYPRVIEDALYQHPSVREAVVIGVADRYRGQAPKAFVTLKHDAATSPSELREFLKDYISKIEMPRDIEIRETLPKTMIGKLSKKELIAEEHARQATKTASIA